MTIPEYKNFTHEEMRAFLEELADQLRAGLPVKAAIRAYMTDGTIQHFVIAPTIEEEDELRAALEAEYSNPQ